MASRCCWVRIIALSINALSSTRSEWASTGQATSIASSVASRLMTFCGALGIGASWAASVMRAATSISARQQADDVVEQRDFVVGILRTMADEKIGHPPQHFGAPRAGSVRDRGFDIRHEGNRTIHDWRRKLFLCVKTG